MKINKPLHLLTSEELVELFIACVSALDYSGEYEIAVEKYELVKIELLKRLNA